MVHGEGKEAYRGRNWVMEDVEYFRKEGFRDTRTIRLLLLFQRILRRKPAMFMQ